VLFAFSLAIDLDYAAASMPAEEPWSQLESRPWGLRNSDHCISDQVGPISQVHEKVSFLKTLGGIISP